MKKTIEKKVIKVLFRKPVRDGSRWKVPVEYDNKIKGFEWFGDKENAEYFVSKY